MGAGTVSSQFEQHKHTGEGIHSDRQKIQRGGQRRILAGVRSAHRVGTAGVWSISLGVVCDVAEPGSLSACAIGIYPDTITSTPVGRGILMIFANLIGQ